MILYTTNCPKCKQLKMILDKHKIEYDVEKDIEVMILKNFKSVPKFELDDGTILDFEETVQYIQKGGI